MHRLNLTCLRRQPERSRRDLEKPRCFAEIQPRFDAVVGRVVDGDAVMRAQRGDTLTRPAVAVTSQQSVPVQDTGNEVVIGDQRQLAHRGDNIGGRAVALSAPPFR